MPIAASEVAAAGRSSKRSSRISAGTTTIPPPTPSRALKNPAARPIATSRATTGSYPRWVTADVLIERIAEAPERTGILLDFDGVLAPIVERPEDAAVPAETRAELERLGDKYVLVAAVSAPDGEDVAERANVARAVVVGSHGPE